MAISKKELRSVWAVSAAMAVAFVVLVRALTDMTVYASDAGDYIPPEGQMTQDISDVPASAKPLVVSRPQTLEIPTLSIQAKVQYVGLSRSGDLGTPNNFTDVAWYKYGPLPGDPGSAIIDGHVDNGLGLAGVFKNLSSIKIGDDIYVTTVDGVKLTFKVTGVSTYGYRDVPHDAIFGSNSSQRILKLITCDGTWVSSAKTYDQRLIVTAELSQ